MAEQTINYSKTREGFDGPVAQFWPTLYLTSVQVADLEAVAAARGIKDFRQVLVGVVEEYVLKGRLREESAAARAQLEERKAAAPPPAPEATSLKTLKARKAKLVKKDSDEFAELAAEIAEAREEYEAELATA